MKLLVIQSDTVAYNERAKTFLHSGLDCMFVNSFQRALVVMERHSFSAVFCTLSLSSASGAAFAALVRKRHMLLVLLSSDVRAAFNDGSSNVVTLLNAPPLVLAKQLHSLLKERFQNPCFKVGSVVHDPKRNIVTRGDKTFLLRKKESQLLSCLMQNAYKVLDRGFLMESIWDYNLMVVTNTLDVHMSNLRKKIDGGFVQKCIHTVYGVGYKFGFSS